MKPISSAVSMKDNCYCSLLYGQEYALEIKKMFSDSVHMYIQYVSMFQTTLHKHLQKYVIVMLLDPGTF